MAELLTTGGLLRILCDEKLVDPIFQILQSRKIASVNDKDRHRLLLSDGKFQITHAMLTGVPSVEPMSIVKLKKYHLSEVNVNNSDKPPQKVLLIVDIDVVSPGSAVGSKIGNPENLSGEDLRTIKRDNTNGSVSSTNLTHMTSSNTSDARSQIKSEPSSFMSQSLSETRMISQISSITPYHNKWVIKARISNKSQLRTWSNSKGEGKLFSVDLMDESGEIRMTAFRDLADKYYNYLQVDKVYHISKCQVKPAIKQYNTLKNDYEMTVGNETIIEECLIDDGLVPQVKYNFVTIDKLETSTTGAMVDVIGVCKEASDVQTFVSKSTNRELKKREVVLVDQSQTSISLTLWGAQAESFDASNNPVVVIRGAKIGEFGGGKNLSALMSSQLKINPDIPECHRIKGWFETKGKDTQMKNLSEKTGIGGLQTPWMCLKEVQDKGLGSSEKGDYFQTCATILLVRSENAMYKACPSPECNKKVVDMENGMYRCEKCAKEYPNFKYRLLVSMNIGDFSGNQWVSAFAGEAEKILGKSSQEIGLIMEDNSEAATAIFQAANFKQFIFKCRAKLETYNDEQRLKTVVVNVDPIDYEKHNSYLAEEIQKLMA